MIWHDLARSGSVPYACPRNHLGTIWGLMHEERGWGAAWERVGGCLVVGTGRVAIWLRTFRWRLGPTVLSHCNPLYLAVSGCISLHLAVSGCISLYLAVSRCIPLYPAVPRCISLYLAVSRCISIYPALHSAAVLCTQMPT